jgi:DNA-directed RNA polymerase subunit RPC12/RpoP
MNCVLGIVLRKEAREKGLKRYFSGKPCLKGHISERYVLDYGCVQCKKEYSISIKDKEIERGKLLRASGKAKKARLKNRYKISLEDLGVILERQGNKCLICGIELKSGIYSHIDHDHKTGKVRGVLCKRCNNGIGYLMDDPVLLRVAAEYIERLSMGP